MASAPATSSSVAASSRKEHLEAGKKRLEQFRKKKARKKSAAAAAEQAKPSVPDVVDKPPPIANTASSGEGLVYDADPSMASTFPVTSTNYENDPISSSRVAESQSNSATVSADAGVSSISPQQEVVNDGGSKFYGNLSYSDLVNGHPENWRGDTVLNKDEQSPEKEVQSTSQLDAFENTTSFGSRPPADTLPSWRRDSLPSQLRDSEQSSSSTSNTLFRRSDITYTQDHSTNNDIFGRFRATTKDSSQVEQSVYTNSRDYSSTFNSFRNVGTVDHNTDVEINRKAEDSTPVSFDKQDPFLSAGYPTSYTRSRPSFLDSIGVQRAPPTTQVCYGEPAKAKELSSKSNYQGPFLQQSNHQSTGSSAGDISLTLGSQEYNHEKGSYGNSIPPDFSVFKEERSLQHGNQTFKNITTHGKDDFAELEQLIEDLTKEKFSLQRTLEKSQELAETLATDNSALTDKFNQQAHVISQLTSDMERLQEEIQAQLLALESVRTEYANAQLECSAADERAKVLAAEVILLEDKALKLRSSELKLEKQVEGLHSEISSYRRKVSSLEKERQHLQSTVEALQEEKRLLYSKLRDIPVNDKINIIEKSSADKRDASTATEGLDTGEISSSETLTSTVDTLEDAGTSVLRSNNTVDFPSLEEVSTSIPDDQLRMIDNINSLMSELAVEREELLRALRIESSNCSKLKELNKDLTQKLEIQTQRLELLISQRMANENVLAKPVDTRSINDATMYADEGDEVVERVLGWIIKLFPGGSKRRTSKLL